MKVLQINSVYEYGSTGKLVHALHMGMTRQGVESLVCYGRREKVTQPGVTMICSDLYGKLNNLRSRFTGLMYGGCVLSTERLIRFIQSQKPDVVHLQCINGYFVNIYRLVSWLKAHQIPTVLTLHAEFMYTANCGHAFDCEKWKTGCGSCPRFRQETNSLLFDGTAASFRKMQRAFDGFQPHLRVVSVSPWLMGRAKESLILGDMQHRVIYNGVDTGIFHGGQKEMLRRKLGLGSEKIIFHATAMFSDRMDHPKGGGYVLELARRLKDLPCTVLVAGKCGAISGSLPENVRLLGEVQDQKRLAELYAAADLTVLTSKAETFSMVCAESLCCGTPVVGFRAGAPEQIALPRYSQFVSFGDSDGLEGCVRRWLEMPAEPEQIAAEGCAAYSQNTMVEQYLSIYRELING